MVLCGEFSRTPKMNDGGNGGAAVQHGHAGPRPLGQLDVLPAWAAAASRAARSSARPTASARARTRGPLTPANIHATIYQVLGIDPKLQLLDPERPAGVGAGRSDAD